MPSRLAVKIVRLKDHLTFASPMALIFDSSAQVRFKLSRSFTIVSCAPAGGRGILSPTLYQFLYYFCHFVVRMEMFPIENSGRVSQAKPSATESRYPSLINPD